LGQSFFIESGMALSLKRESKCALKSLDNAGIVREAIFQKQPGVCCELPQLTVPTYLIL
jgi:hypothetical protein